MNDTVRKPAFKIIGIAVDTSNKNMQARKDIGALWQRFHTEDIFDKIPDKLSSDVYSLYTDYQGDYQAPYRTIIGCMVADGTCTPAGMVEKNIPEQIYEVYSVTGNIIESVGNTWISIWENDQNLQRAYIADFDVYSAKSSAPDKPEVEIFVGLK